MGERIILSLALALMLIACSSSEPMDAPAETLPSASFSLTSPVFSDGERIPDIYTCLGDDISPPLDISGIPDDTRSLVLIVEDPDAPAGTWIHWVVYNIQVVESFEEDRIPIGGWQGRNSWGDIGYGGPCPPDGEHRYIFTVYAIDVILDIMPDLPKSEVLGAIEGHVLGEAKIIGTFSKNQ